MNERPGCKARGNGVAGGPSARLAVVVGEDRGEAAALSKTLLAKGLSYDVFSQVESVLVRLAGEAYRAVVAVGHEGIEGWSELTVALERYYPKVALASLGRNARGELELRPVKLTRDEADADASPQQPPPVNVNEDRDVTRLRTAHAVDESDEPDMSAETGDEEAGRLTHEELAMLLGGEWE